jgi:hypothetical protein
MPTHRVSKSDDLWSLADRYYGDRSAWRLIFDANRGVLRDVETPLRPGLLLIIPLNAEDAADWPDVTDDEYGVVDARPPSGQGDDLVENGLIEGAHSAEANWSALIKAAIVLVMLFAAVLLIHYCSGS